MKPSLLPRKFYRLQVKLISSRIGFGHSDSKHLLTRRPYSTLESQSVNADSRNKTVHVMTLAKNLADLMEEQSLIPPSEMNGHNRENVVVKSSLAVDLASSIRESCEAIESKRKPRKTRLDVKRFLELRVKKKVKEQFRDGKFHDLFSKVISDLTTLENAYDCLRVASNVDLSSEGDGLGFQSISEELASGNFDVEANIYSLSTRGRSMKKELLVFPNLRLRVVQEAIRIALEVVYRPHFRRISHGLRSNRGHCSASKYVKGISDPDWWFTLLPRKKVDDSIFGKLVSTLEERITDPGLVDILRKMFDAGALNLEFGGFPKGHGLPQEGLLSPILMNIYLDLFDREISRLTMQFETSVNNADTDDERSNSKLRSWFRRQINGKKSGSHDSDVRIHCVRFMDEIFVAISGPEEVALHFKSDAEMFLKNSLHLEIDNQEMVSCREAGGAKFLGTLIKRRKKESPSVIAVHKLRDKVKMFVDQKEEQWTGGAVRIGKKWLAHGLKKVKESEIEHLSDPASLLSQVSSFRKPGMRTDHWYKELLKIWMQGVDAKNAGKDEESILVKLVVEPSLPRELTDSFHEFRRLAREYVSSETASTLSLLPGKVENGAVSITEILAPVKVISKRLHRYGITYRGGYARPCNALILLDDDQIVDWFAGIAIRWLRWYRHCDNSGEVKRLISDQVRRSCIRTLAAKYRIHEANVEARFDSELSRIPEDFDVAVSISSPEQRLHDGALTYGMNFSGACLVSVARVAVESSRPCPCFVVGCRSSARCVYTIRVMERQRFPAWKTGFPSCIHPSLNGRRIGMCKPHLKDLFLGDISLQSVEFGAWWIRPGRRSSAAV